MTDLRYVGKAYSELSTGLCGSSSLREREAQTNSGLN
jgi:hypothetical protein